MNKFILSIMMSLAVMGCVHADTIKMGDTNVEGKGAKFTQKKVISHTKKDESTKNKKGEVKNSESED